MQSKNYVMFTKVQIFCRVSSKDSHYHPLPNRQNPMIQHKSHQQHQLRTWRQKKKKLRTALLRLGQQEAGEQTPRQWRFYPPFWLRVLQFLMVETDRIDQRSLRRGVEARPLTLLMDQAKEEPSSTNNSKKNPEAKSKLININS